MTKINVVYIEEVEQWEYPLSRWFSNLIDNTCAICGQDLTAKCNNGGCDE